MTRPMFPYAERLKAQMLAVIKDPSQWPHPVLPVKRHTEDGHNLEFGVLRFTVQKPSGMSELVPIVYSNTLFVTDTRLAFEPIHYPDWDAFFADGWVVD
jgi:hypothetical protein